MRVLLVLCAIAGYVAAEAGYQYNPPQSSYGVPTQTYSSGSSGSFNQGAGFQVVKSVPSVSYSSGPSSYDSGSSYQGGSGGGYIGGSSSGFQSGGSGFGASSVVSSVPSYQVSGSSQGNYAANYQTSVTQQGPAQVYKHFYVHSAPEEPQTQVRQSLVLPAPQKHYKVIFIKAPTASAASTQFVPVPVQNEEKTLVYVLSNKAQQAQNVVVPKFAPKPPSKPEVFFIKYNNKEDSHAVINNIVNDFNAKQPGQVTFSGVDNAESSGAVSGSIGGGVSQGLSNGVADSGSQSFSVGSGSSGLEASNIVSFTGGSEGSESQGGFSSGGFSSGGQGATVNFASQTVPHVSYGVPSFRT